MRISGLLGAVIALSALAPIAPAHAVIELAKGVPTYTFGELPQTNGKTLGIFNLDWEFANYTERTSELIPFGDCALLPYIWGEFYIWETTYEPPRPVTSAVDPIGLPDGGYGYATTVSVDPFVTPGGDAPDGAAAVPEPSTWAMLLLGFVGLGYAAIRRGKAARDLFTANKTGALVRQTASPDRPTYQNRRPN